MSPSNTAEFLFALRGGRWFYNPDMIPLAQSKLFAQLPPEALWDLQSKVVSRSCPSGTEIFKEGDPGDGVYYIQSGQIHITSFIAKDVKHVFAQIGPGEIFGEMAVLEDKPRSAAAMAAVDSDICFISRDTMLALLERSPAFTRMLLREISARLREFNHQYIREVLQAERLAIVGKFARSIIHDLKNPLNIISLSTEMASMRTATEESRSKANQYIRKQVEHITDMVNEILEFTQGSPSSFTLGAVDYARFIESVVKEITPELALKSIRLEVANPPPATRLMLNPRRLHHLFNNLIHNAVEFMPSGGRILLRFKSDNDEVVTEVQDSGPGIAPEIAGRLFEAFATHGKTHGTGLGLSICKKIVEDHHGWITARNATEGGAIFAFGLPLPR